MDTEKWVTTVNEVSSLNLKYDEEAENRKLEEEERERDFQREMQGMPPGGTAQNEPPNKANQQPQRPAPPLKAASADYDDADASRILTMVQRYLSGDLSEDAVELMSKSDKAHFNDALSARLFVDMDNDPKGLEDILKCACDIGG